MKAEIIESARFHFPCLQFFYSIIEANICKFNNIIRLGRNIVSYLLRYSPGGLFSTSIFLLQGYPYSVHNIQQYGALFNHLESRILYSYIHFFLIYVLLYINIRRTYKVKSVQSTLCPRSIDPFYVVTYYMKWIKSS